MTRHQPIRAQRATLTGFDGVAFASFTMVLADELPEIVMFHGEPYLKIATDAGHGLFYRKVRPYRADVG